MILTLPDVLIHTILSYCEYKDTLRVAILNRYFLGHVEAYSGEKLDKMREDHNVDPSWLSRLGVEAAGNRPRTHQPPTFSNRHLLKCALQTHLYCIGSPDLNCASVRLVCLPDGKTLLTSGFDARIRIWDLESQQCIRSFAPPNNKNIDSLHFSAGHIISTSRLGFVHIFTKEGICLHSIQAGGYSGTRAFATCGSQSFFASRTLEESTDFVSVVDIPSGERTLHVQQTWNPDMIGRQMDMLVAGEWVLVMCGVDEFLEQDDEAMVPAAVEQAGIYVLNRSDLIHKSTFHGNFERIVSSEDGSRIIAVGAYGAIGVLKLDDNGYLVLLRSFVVHELTTTTHFFSKAVVLSGSRLYIAPPIRDHNAIIVFDINSGEKIRSMHYPTTDLFTGATFYPRSMATNGREVFCGFSIDPMHRSMSAIKAYPI